MILTTMSIVLKLLPLLLSGGDVNDNDDDDDDGPGASQCREFLKIRQQIL